MFHGALELSRTLRDAGYRALWAGGVARDLLLGRMPRDIDIATDATPDDVQALFPRAIPTGKVFGVMNVLCGETAFEIATFRTEASYSDGRRPDRVEFSTPEEDARRRDFTVNSLFYDPFTDSFIDYTGGKKDLQDRLIRAVGDPAERFREDHLRLLRAVRFASTLGFCLEPNTRRAMEQAAPLITRISPERVRDELDRLLRESPKAGAGVALLRETGLLPPLLPEVEDLVGQEQPPQFHPEGDVFTHTTQMLDAMPDRPGRVLAWSVLLHDIGKPPTAAIGPGADGTPRIRFDRHAAVGADMARDILTRLRFPKRDVEAIEHCVRHHMRFMEVQRMRPATLRRLIGRPTFPVELELHRLDCLCSHGKLDNIDFLEAFQARLAAEPVLPERWVTGHDILALGVPPGPEVGRWLARAYDRQMEGAARTREELLDWLRDQMQSERRSTLEHDE